MTNLTWELIIIGVISVSLVYWIDLVVELTAMIMHRKRARKEQDNGEPK